MPALNYQKRFAALVEHGYKRSTIRATRKRPICIGDTLYHFTGMRTKQCRPLGRNTCTVVMDICIKPTGTVLLDGVALYRESAGALANHDGFDSLQAFFDFFCPKGKVFHGQYIQW